MITSITFILEYDNVHGRILAVNMAHLRKKRQTAESSSMVDNRNSSLQLGDNRNSSSGGNVFNGIQEVNKGKEASAT